MNCETHKAVVKFLPAQFLCTDKYVFEAILSIQRFSIWPNKEKFSQNIHCSLCMQECQFEFDTSHGNDLWIHFSNNQFINRVLEGVLDLPWLYQVKTNEKNHFSVVIMMSLFTWFSLFFIVCPSYKCHNIFLLWVFLFFSGLVYKRSAQGSSQYLGEYMFGQVPWAVGYAPLHCLTVGPHW